jgi:hypothetical protein
MAADADVEGDEGDEAPEPDVAEAVDLPRAEAAPERVTPQLATAAPEAREAAAPELPAAPSRDSDRDEPQ